MITFARARRIVGDRQGMTAAAAQRRLRRQPSAPEHAFAQTVLAVTGGDLRIPVPVWPLVKDSAGRSWIPLLHHAYWLRRAAANTAQYNEHSSEILSALGQAIAKEAPAREHERNEERTYVCTYIRSYVSPWPGYVRTYKRGSVRTYVLERACSGGQAALERLRHRPGGHASRNGAVRRRMRDSSQEEVPRDAVGERGGAKLQAYVPCMRHARPERWGNECTRLRRHRRMGLPHRDAQVCLSDATFVVKNQLRPLLIEATPVAVNACLAFVRSLGLSASSRYGTYGTYAPDALTNIGMHEHTYVARFVHPHVF